LDRRAGDKRECRYHQNAHQKDIKSFFHSVLPESILTAVIAVTELTI